MSRPRPAGLAIGAAVAVAGLLAALAPGIGRSAPASPSADGTSSRGPVGEARSARASVTVEREVAAMGTRLRARVRAASRAEAVAAAESAFAAVARTDSLLSTWRDDTELARLNAAPVGRRVRLSPRLYRLLEAALAWTRRTGGAFDPAVGALVDAWELRDGGRVPAPARLEAARRASGPACFALDRGGRAATRRCADAWLDSGAFGKGAALRAAARALDGAEAAVLDFGGQVLALGPGPDGGWPVGVASPRRRDRPALTLRVPGGSVATTGQSERSVVVDGVSFGHVLDPRTGRPAEAWGSATVAAADPLVADVLSTALFVMGPERGARWAAGREDVGVVLLREGEDGLVACLNRRAAGMLDPAGHRPGPEIRILPDGGPIPSGIDRSPAATEGMEMEEAMAQATNDSTGRKATCG